MKYYDAKVFDYFSLPPEIESSLTDYYAGADRSVPNDSFHPFPLDGFTIEEALDEASYGNYSDNYKNLLRWFYSNCTRWKAIIHFNW